VRCDVSDDAQVAAMVDRTVAEFGRIDAAFNNAGVMAHIAPTAESTREDWDHVIGINLRGVWSCMKHELRHMERQGSGAIVNNASVGALTREERSDRSRRQARGDRRNGAVALQSWRELRCWSCAHRGRRDDRCLISHGMSRKTAK